MRHPGRHESHSGTTILERQAKALAFADGDIDAQIAWGLQKCQG